MLDACISIEMRIAVVLVTLALAGCNLSNLPESYGSKQEAYEAKEKWLEAAKSFTFRRVVVNPKYVETIERLRCDGPDPDSRCQYVDDVFVESKYVLDITELSTRKCDDDPNLTYFQYVCRERKPSKQDLSCSVFNDRDDPFTLETDGICDDAAKYREHPVYEEPKWYGTKFIYFRANT